MSETISECVRHLIDSGIAPEKLPPAEDAKKLERRLGSEHKEKTKKKAIKKSKT